MVEICKLPMKQGATWIKEGWDIFRKTPTILILLLVSILVIEFLLGLVPFGGLIVALIAPALSGGYYIALENAEAERPVGFPDLFRAFNDERVRTPMLTLGAIALGVHVLMMLITMLLGAGSLSAMMAYHDMIHGGVLGMADMSVAYIALGINLAILLVLWLALFFAIPLVMLGHVNPLEALMLSLKANFSNFGAWLVFSVITLVLLAIAIFPFGLGLIFWFPISAAAIYRAYRESFRISMDTSSQIEDSASTAPIHRETDQ